jgi:hypothetical protein
MSKTCIISIRRGALHFSAGAYEKYFAGLENVVLLRDGDQLIIMPVRHAAAGGSLIKIRNAMGDRSVAAADFFRDAGIEDSLELSLPASWDDGRAALIVAGVFD